MQAGKNVATNCTLTVQTTMKIVHNQFTAQYMINIYTQNKRYAQGWFSPIDVWYPTILWCIFSHSIFIQFSTIHITGREAEDPLKCIVCFYLLRVRITFGVFYDHIIIVLCPYVYVTVQFIPRNIHTVFALLCFVVVIHWLIFPYPPTIAPVPAKQPWWIWINTSCEFIMNNCITTTKQNTTKPCAYFLGYTVNKCC